eukprot:scaffold2358_cov19-Tisochrysis_lutea.AAC.1
MSSTSQCCSAQCVEFVEWNNTATSNTEHIQFVQSVKLLFNTDKPELPGIWWYKPVMLLWRAASIVKQATCCKKLLWEASSRCFATNISVRPRRGC